MTESIAKVISSTKEASPVHSPAPGDQIELRLASGELLQASIVSVRAGAEKEQVATRSKTWRRWRGTPQDVVQLAQRLSEQVSENSGADSDVTVDILLGVDDEERYHALEDFESDVNSLEPGTPGARLREIQVVQVLIAASTATEALRANLVFSRLETYPAVRLAIEASRRTIAEGLLGTFTKVVDAGKPRVPALPGPVLMLLGGVVGVLYGYGFYSVDWSFVPDGGMGEFIVLFLYLLGFVGLIYGFRAVLTAVLPQFVLSRPGVKTPVEVWRPRLLKGAAALATALLPFILERVLGN